MALSMELVSCTVCILHFANELYARFASTRLVDLTICRDLQPWSCRCKENALAAPFLQPEYLQQQHRQQQQQQQQRAI